MPSTREPMIRGFTSEDRCDRCQSQAYVMARHMKHGELFFCLHHAAKHTDNLLDREWEVTEDYEAISRLTGKPISV